MDKLETKYFEMIQSDNLKKATMADLKEFLTAKNLPVNGKKDFLIDLVTEYFETNFTVN